MGNWTTGPVFHSADEYVEFIIDFIIDKGDLSSYHLCKIVRVYGSDNSSNTILICSGYQIIEAMLYNVNT